MKPSNAAFWITLALLGSSLEPIFVKLSQNEHVSSFQLIVLKLFCGGIMICLLLPKFKLPTGYVFKRLVFISILAAGINYCTYLSLETLSVPIVITVLATTPVFVGLLGQVQGRVQLRKEFWAGFCAIVVGILLSFDYAKVSFQGLSYLGIIFVASAVLGSTLYRTNVEKLCESVDPFQISFFIFFINGILAACLLPWVGEIHQQTWPLAIWLGFSGIIANVAFIKAIHVLGPTKTSLVSLLQRPFVILISTFVLNTPLNILQMIGVLFVILGVKYAKADKSDQYTKLKRTEGTI